MAAALTILVRSRLDPALQNDVLQLIDVVAQSDGIGPLSEQALLDIRFGGRGLHLLSYAGARDAWATAGQARPGMGAGAPAPNAAGTSAPDTDPAAAALVGYAHLQLDAHPVGAQSGAAEVAVHPQHRRAGIGRSLVDEAARRAPGLRLWSHGKLEPAQRFASSAGYVIVRELWQLRRLLGPGSEPLPPAELPPGFAARSFRPGADDERWLVVNARAFARHAEQGRLTESDLAARLRQEWFDAEGFILVEDLAPTRGPRLAAFHWTKIPAADAQGAPRRGEVYVVGVDPAYQGRGLGRAVTLLGLHHLRERGVQEVALYVDGDNTAAMATYRRLGFEEATVDVMYAQSKLK